MPTSITIEADKKNQEPTKNAHFAQVLDELNLQIGLKTKISGIGKLIFVDQVDPCGNGWEQLIPRKQSHIYIFQKLQWLNFSKTWHE